MAFQAQRDSTPQTVAGRLLSTLEAFGPDSRALTLSEISRSTGLPLTTTFRIVAELAEWGALERRPDRRYTIGYRLARLASLIPNRNDLPLVGRTS